MPEATLEVPVTPAAPDVGPNMEDMVSFITKSAPTPAKAPEPVKVDVVTPPVEKTPEQPVKGQEIPKPEPTKTEPVKDSSKEENLANLRKLVGEHQTKAEAAAKALEDAAKERDELRKQYEEYRTRVPETAADEAKRLREQYDQERKTREEIEKELKSSSYERSPEYKSTYVKPVQDGMKSMLDIAIEAGIPAAEAQAGINAWDKSKFSEWYTQMDEFQKGDFMSHRNVVQRKYAEGQEAIKQANTNWEKIQSQKTEEAERQKQASLTGYRKLADETISAFLANESIKEAPEAQEMIRRGVQKVADQQFTPAELMQQAAALPIYHHMAQQQLKTIEAHEAKIAEMTKKLEEQEEFIKKSTGGQPFPGSSNTPASDSKVTPFIPWEELRVG